MNDTQDRTGPSAASLSWSTVALLMALCFLCHFNRISMSVAGTEQIMAQYKIDPTTMGTVYSAYLLVYTLMMIPGGWLIDRKGARFALSAMGLGAGLLVMATGGVGWLAVPALVLPGLLVVRSLLGLASVPMHPGAARAVADCVPPKSRSLANGLVTTAALVGIASTYYLFGYLIDRFGWPVAFVICGCVTLGVAAVWTFFSPRRPARFDERTSIDAVAKPSGRWYELLANRSLMLLTLSYAAVGYFQYLFFFWLEYYFDTYLELGRETSRLYTTIPMLAMALGMFGGGWIADAVCRRIEPYRGRALVAMFGMLGGTLFLGLGVMVEDPRWIVVWFSCAMGSVGMSEGPFWVTAVELGGRRGGMSAAIFNTGGNAGGILAPVVTPWLSGYLGWSGALPVAGLFCLIGAALWWWVRPTSQSEPH